MNSCKKLLHHLTLALSAMTWICATRAADDATVTNPPYLVAVELGDAQFAPGDSITIQKISGTSAMIATGGTYCVEGTYTLSSRDEAELAWFMTDSSDAPSTPIDPRQIIRVTKGAGSFRLTRAISRLGYLHLSFYPHPSGSSFGGIYFGQGKWVLHHGYHGQFTGATGHLHQNGSQPHDLVIPSLSVPNLAMLEYLGNAVEAPADLPASYSRQGLKQAIETAAQQSGAVIRKIEIEDSEFPPLVGVICDEADCDKLLARLKTRNDYAYQGGVGSHTCHAMSIIPYRAFPEGSGEQIERRLMLREQMFYNELNAEE